MKIKVGLKFSRVSPNKIRPLLKNVKGQPPLQLVNKLQFAPQRSANIITKLLKAGLSAAKNKGIDPEKLTIDQFYVNHGPRLKRYRAGSRGYAMKIAHQLGHLTLVLEDSSKEKK